MAQLGSDSLVKLGDVILDSRRRPPNSLGANLGRVP